MLALRLAADLPLGRKLVRPGHRVQGPAGRQHRKIHWVPGHVGDKRFADWLANARDWAVSRHRFWGAPVPVWRCDACRATEVIGSRAALAERGHPDVDWHRPAIDGVTWPCRCGGTLRRVPDVLDCWFESDAMPFAQQHYPFADRAEFEAAFPGDFIVEYVAQTRGWFYTLLVLSTALFDAPPFKHAVCHGVLLGEDGRITTLSTWYLRLLKPSLWRPGLDAAKRASYEALHAALTQLARLAAPFLPFLAEQVHATLGGAESVHLEDWPPPRDDVRDDALVAEMRRLRDAVRIARRVREQAGVKHRQPLRRAYVAGLGAALAANRAPLETELNVKEVHELTDVASAVRAELVLDYARLGKRLRGQVKAVAAAVLRGEFRELPDGRFEAAGCVLAADADLDPDRRSARLGRARGRRCGDRGRDRARVIIGGPGATTREGMALAVGRMDEDPFNDENPSSRDPRQPVGPSGDEHGRSRGQEEARREVLFCAERAEYRSREAGRDRTELDRQRAPHGGRSDRQGQQDDREGGQQDPDAHVAAIHPVGESAVRGGSLDSRQHDDRAGAVEDRG
ncbi:MAG TPA: class I tRNA ligase family protein [Kofleriaceae bacterium]